MRNDAAVLFQPSDHALDEVALPVFGATAQAWNISLIQQRLSIGNIAGLPA